MKPIVINNFDEMNQFVGKEIGTSDYMKITQEQINLFADATHDHQWIHVDEARAKKESPFKSTIAHGYLTLSLIPHLWDQVVTVNNSTMTVNYGIEKLKFGQAVTVNSEVRAIFKLDSLINLRGTTKAEVSIKMEIKDQKKAAFEAKVLFLYHFV